MLRWAGRTLRQPQSGRRKHYFIFISIFNCPGNGKTSGFTAKGIQPQKGDLRQCHSIDEPIDSAGKIMDSLFKEKSWMASLIEATYRLQLPGPKIFVLQDLMV